MLDQFNPDRVPEVDVQPVVWPYIDVFDAVGNIGEGIHDSSWNKESIGPRSWRAAHEAVAISMH